MPFQYGKPSSGGGYTFGGGGGSSAPKKDDSPHGITGFFQNLGSDIADLRGIPAGLWALGGSVVHDNLKAYGLADGEWQLDDVAGAIKDSYYQTYVKPFMQHDGVAAWKHLGKNIYDAPLSPILDAASVVTGGGSLAAKLGAKAATSSGSAFGARVAGLRHVDEITPSTIRPRAGIGGTYAAATRPIVDPLTGRTLHQMPVHHNPVIRARKNLMEGFYAKLPATNYMSPTRRGARLGEAETRRVARREAANLERAYFGAIEKLSRDEKDALVYMAQGFNTVERAGILRQQRLARAAEVSAQKATDADGGKRAADTVDLVSDAKVLERVTPLIENPSDALREALAQQSKINDEIQAQFARNLIREGKTPEEANTIIMQRAQGPLRAVGIEPGTELPMILSHVEDAGSYAKRNKSLERGLTTKILDEERATDYTNFLNARYQRDPTIAVATHRVMFAKEQTFDRIENAIRASEPYDQSKHAALVASGKLKWVDKRDAIIANIKYVDDSMDRFENQLGDFADVEVDAIREAYGAMYDLVLKDKSPGVVIPTPHYNELVGQFKGARSLIEKITDKLGNLTRTWKHVVLSLKGSFYVNNFIGNTLLGFIAYGPRYLLDVAKESLPSFARGSMSRRISEGVSDLERTAGARNVADAAKAARWDVISRLGEKVAGKGVLLTEDNFRRAAFRRNLRKRTDEFAAARPDLSRHEAIEAILNDKSAVDQLAEQTYGDLLDYSKLTPLEKELLLPVMPFWNFTRAMTGRTIRLTLDEPWKLRVLLYFGQSGIEANEDALPDDLELPDFLKGMILLDKTGDTPRVLSTYGMNPFVAPVDLASQVGGIFGSTDDTMNPLASFNPFVKAPLEAITGRDFFTQQDIQRFDGSEPDSFGGKLVTQLSKNIPQYAMVKRYQYPSMYPSVERDAGDTALQYAGVPLGSVNPANIERVNEIVAALKRSEEASRQRRIEAKQEIARF